MASKTTIKTVLLNALPAGGKSEIRKFLKYLGKEKCCEKFLIGEFVQLDDYPYVDIMRKLDEALGRLGETRMFFELPDRGFQSDYDWATLMFLINEDYEDLVNKPIMPQGISAARWLFQRMDAARSKAGITRLISDLPARSVWHLEDLLETRCKSLMVEKFKGIPETLEGKTVVIEFSRGGAHGMPFPLPEPLGYEYNYAQLSPRILDGAAVLYVSITPEMSRNKNDARGREAVGDAPTSIGAQIMHSLNHSVPAHVMWNAYGCDDIAHLVKTSDVPSTVKISAHGKAYHLPIAFFDNTPDYTTFCRGAMNEWKTEDVTKLNNTLTEAFKGLVEQYKNLHP
eukprot:TRINITY_DN6348_c0_g1_i1.p1 TRINITY_DN6348_c0_g1~~TRINITY_DN6348_c0_g1_i1.p1  ORF type:complete len:353 (+),score=130.16 TRINITY_DN6348_c0_g1_i1:39-1061(+)